MIYLTWSVSITFELGVRPNEGTCSWLYNILFIILLKRGKEKGRETYVPVNSYFNDCFWILLFNDFIFSSKWSRNKRGSSHHISLDINPSSCTSQASPCIKWKNDFTGTLYITWYIPTWFMTNKNRVVMYLGGVFYGFEMPVSVYFLLYQPTVSTTSRKSHLWL